MRRGRDLKRSFRVEGTDEGFNDGGGVGDRAEGMGEGTDVMLRILCSRALAF